MAVYALADLVPQIHPDAYVHPAATVIGNVSIGAGASIWPGAVLRGDYGRIVVGERTSIQDGSVLHAVPHLPTLVGAECVIGHLVHLEGCIIEDHALIGSGSIVLHHAIVREWGQVAAGAVVRPKTEVPSHALAVGVPCVIKEGLARPAEITQAAEVYVMNAQRYRNDLRQLF